MKEKWNHAVFEEEYRKIQLEALNKGYKESELADLKMENLLLQTNSPRIVKMVSLAYTLGRLRELEELDDK
jgi:hypothetical protein